MKCRGDRGGGAVVLLADFDQQVAGGVPAERCARGNDRGCTVLGDDGGAGVGFADGELLAVVDAGCVGLAVEGYRLLHNFGRLARALWSGAEPWCVRLACGDFRVARKRIVTNSISRSGWL